MTKEKDVWYHCGHCGTLFQSDFGFDENRVCESCEKNPRVSLWAEESSASIASSAKLAGFEKQGDIVGSDGRRAVRKKRRVNVMMRVVIIWTLLMLGIVGLRHYYAKSGPENGRGDKVSNKMTEGTLADERIAILNSSLSDCHRALGGFLTSGTPEARNQFVANSVDTAGKLAIYYARNPFPKVDVASMRRTEEEVIRVGGEWMIHTRWEEIGDDGVVFDALFQREGATWKLDWLHFSRYSDFPWSLFLAGEGPDVGEFRLLARQRLRDDEKERQGARMTFELLQPKWGRPAEASGVAQEFVVDRRGDEGLLLGAAFEAKANNESLFGGSLTPIDSDGLARVRVKIKREEIGGVRRFEIESIPACHWIDSDAVGFDLDVLKDDLFGGN